MSPARLYRTLFVSGLAGVLFIGGAAWFYPGISICLFRRLTGLPCPCCGVTTAVGDILLRHDFKAALMRNPLGLVVALAVVSLPLLLLGDLLLGRRDVYRIYLGLEQFARRPVVFFILIALTLVNWIWNLFKFQ